MITIAKPELSGNELNYVTDAIRSGWISSKGPYVQKFEELFSAKHRSRYGVACSSGTAALILALRALQIGPGDEVIVPEFTMIACAWAVTLTGATPVFVDCDERLNIDPELIPAAITQRTKAIMPVHIYGRLCDTEKIKRIAYEYNLRIIEDSCEAHGTRPFGDITCFSLYANKIISSGEGGICLTNDEWLDRQLRHLRAMAFDEAHTFHHKKFAYNFRMSNVQAAIALAQTERLEAFLGERKQIEAWYDSELENMDGVKLLPERDVLWIYDFVAQDRDGLMDFLKAKGIETRPFFKPMSMQPMYFDKRHLDTRAYAASLSGIQVPTYNGMTRDTVRGICKAIGDFYDYQDQWRASELQARPQRNGRAC